MQIVIYDNLACSQPITMLLILDFLCHVIILFWLYFEKGGDAILYMSVHFVMFILVKLIQMYID